MERRVLLAIFLSFLVLYVYQALVVKPQPAEQAANATTAASGAATPGVSPRTTAPTATPQNALAPPHLPPSSADASRADGRRRDRASATSRVENADVIAVFTNRGARLKNWKLKKYFDRAKQPQELVEQLPNAAAAVYAAHAERRRQRDH